jgi:hypothetical protein
MAVDAYTLFSVELSNWRMSFRGISRPIFFSSMSKSSNAEYTYYILIKVIKKITVTLSLHFNHDVCSFRHQIVRIISEELMKRTTNNFNTNHSAFGSQFEPLAVGINAISSRAR